MLVEFPDEDYSRLIRRFVKRLPQALCDGGPMKQGDKHGKQSQKARSA